MLKQVIDKTIINFVPIIFGGYVNGYSLARTFYETYCIKSIVCDVKKQFSYYSKFCIFHIVENPNKNINKFINEIISIGEMIRKKSKIPLLLVTNDIWLIPLAKYKNKLENIFIYSFSGWDIIDKLVNKDKLYKLSDSLNIPYPKTIEINPNTNINDDIEQLYFPLLVKPSDVNEYSYHFPGRYRNNIFETKNDIFYYLDFIYSKKYKGSLIIQEYIPGGVENLFTCTTYSDTNGKIKAASTGHKLSQYPPKAGTITSGLVKYTKDIIELTKILLESINYFGIANTEFKYDKRYNSYKLIETNARPGMWNYSVFLSGINIIKFLIDDIIYKKPLFYSESTKDLIWTRIPINELRKNLYTYENRLAVSKLLKEKKVFDPLNNKNDGFLFRLRYYYISLKIFVKSYLNVFFQAQKKSI